MPAPALSSKACDVSAATMRAASVLAPMPAASVFAPMPATIVFATMPAAVPAATATGVCFECEKRHHEE